MEITFIIVVLVFVGILLLVNFDDSLKAKLNIMIGLLFTAVILLIVIVYMQYPQYKNSRDIQNTIQEISGSLQDWGGAQFRTSGGQ